MSWSTKIVAVSQLAPLSRRCFITSPNAPPIAGALMISRPPYSPSEAQPRTLVEAIRQTIRRLSRREVIALLDHLEPPFRLLAEILYGSGLRLLEALAIRIKDVDLERHQILVRRGKGQHDRAALLPTRVRNVL